MSSTDAALIVNARVEYLEQLTDLIGPYVIETFLKMWRDARGSLRRFQTELKAIPKWGSTEFEEHTRVIQERGRRLDGESCDMDKLIAAVLIASVKMLSSVKMSSTTEQVHLKLPTNQAFVRKVFVKAAGIFYNNPGIIEDRADKRMDAVQLGIEKAVRDLLPLNDLLASYIGTEGKGVTEEEDKPEPEPEAEEEEQEAEDEAKDEQEQEPVRETKQVNIDDEPVYTPAPPQPAPVPPPVAQFGQPDQPQPQPQPQHQPQAHPQPQQPQPQAQQPLRHDAGDIDW